MTSKTFAISRAVGVISATAVLATGVTFAALTSNVATLSNNSIAETTATLNVFDTQSGTFQEDGVGFTVTDLVPGPQSSPKPVYLQNSGTTPLALSVHATGAVTWTGLSDYADLNVYIIDTANGGYTPTTMAALLAGNVPLVTAPLPAGAQGDGNASVPGNYTVTFAIAPDKVFGSSLSVGSFNLEFTGTVQ